MSSMRSKNTRSAQSSRATTKVSAPSFTLSQPLRDRHKRNYNSRALILPHEITCGICKKSKNERAFSDNQKQRYATDSYYSITCLDCNGNQKTETKCTVCEKTMPNHRFTKAQLRNKHTAECNNCVMARVSEPKEEPAGSEYGGEHAGDYGVEDDVTTAATIPTTCYESESEVEVEDDYDSDESEYDL